MTTYPPNHIPLVDDLVIGEAQVYLFPYIIDLQENRNKCVRLRVDENILAPRNGDWIDQWEGRPGRMKCNGGVEADC